MQSESAGSVGYRYEAKLKNMLALYRELQKEAKSKDDEATLKALREKIRAFKKKSSSFAEKSRSLEALLDAELASLGDVDSSKSRPAVSSQAS